MSTIEYLWGTGEHLTILQMACRSFVMFFITLILIRLGGMRIFGKKSSFDTIIIIMLGAVLGRGIVGASPFFATVVAAIVMIIIDRVLAWLSLKNQRIGRIVKGEPIVLYRDDTFNWQNMTIASLSKNDLLESLRLETKKDSLATVKVAQMETNGRISFILKEDHL